MSLVVEILRWSAMILTVAVTPLLLWQTVVGVMGLLPMKKRKKVENKVHRFAVVICARHEQAVIGNLIDSLHAQNYPREAFTVFVIADNCTQDDTAEEARRHGAVVYERFNTEKVGKGYALRWALDRIQTDYPDAFDAVAIFDADNLAAPDFLARTNDGLCSGADVTKGYRDCKNPYDTWVSEAYAIYWMMLMRFFHRARYNCGMSCQVDGTGFAFKLSAIAQTGWDTHTLTEDCEFSIQQVCAGRTIIPVYDAVFYDEQPVGWGMSLRQRYRWVVGAAQCNRDYLPTLFRSLKIRSWSVVDMTIYMLCIPAIALMLLGSALGLLALLLNPGTVFMAVLGLCGSALWCWVSMSAMALLLVLLEKKSVRKLWKGILLYPVFLLPMAYMTAAAWIHPKAEWKPIAHTRSESIHDMVKSG